MKRATNAAVMKQINQKLILNLIREKRLSRADIAQETGLTKAAISIIVDELVQEGLISEEPAGGRAVGRRPLLLSLNAGARYIIGVDITRRDYTVGISDLCGSLLCEVSEKLISKRQALNGILAHIIRLVRKNAVETSKVIGIGITCPGPVDPAGALILNPPNFDEWHGEPIGKTLSLATGFPAYLENISSGAALFEMYFGVAKRIDNFMALVVHDGIGSGILIDHTLFRGTSELGHTSICYDGIPCECGNRGCLEKYASIQSIVKGTGFTSWKEVVDAQALPLIEKEARYLGAAAANAANLFDLSAIVLQGDLLYRPELLVSYLKRELKERTIARKEVRVIPGKEYPKALCASAVCLHRFFSENL